MEGMRMNLSQPGKDGTKDEEKKTKEEATKKCVTKAERQGLIARWSVQGYIGLELRARHYFCQLQKNYRANNQ